MLASRMDGGGSLLARLQILRRQPNLLPLFLRLFKWLDDFGLFPGEQYILLGGLIKGKSFFQFVVSNRCSDVQKLFSVIRDDSSNIMYKISYYSFTKGTLVYGVFVWGVRCSESLWYKDRLLLWDFSHIYIVINFFISKRYCLWEKDKRYYTFMDNRCVLSVFLLYQHGVEYETSHRHVSYSSYNRL